MLVYPILGINVDLIYSNLFTNNVCIFLIPCSNLAKLSWYCAVSPLYWYINAVAPSTITGSNLLGIEVVSPCADKSEGYV